MKNAMCVVMVSSLLLLGCSTKQEEAVPEEKKQALEAVSLGIDPQVPLFLGSYRRVPVVIDPQSGLHYEDLDFVVVQGPEGGVISRSKEDSFDPNQPNVLLGAGYATGTYDIKVVDTNSNVVGEASFEVTDAPYLAPGSDGAFWFTGISKPAGLGAAWGGGSSVMPENYAVVPRHGQHNVAVILIQTNDVQYSAQEEADTEANFKQALVDGVFDPGSGEVVSVRKYLEELSGNRYTIGDVVKFGPYTLNGNFNDYFTATDAGDAYPRVDLPASRGLDTWQAAVYLADGQVDFTKFDSAVFVVHSRIVSSGVDNFLWPQATPGSFLMTSNDRISGRVDIPMLWMPHDWTLRSGRQTYETLTHEMFHNMGLWDMYTPAVPRRTDNWEIMSWEWNYPYTTLAHRLMLDWVDVDAGTIKLLNFQASGAVDETVNIAAAGTSPSSGSLNGVEVRISENHNYYLEYRQHTAGNSGDRNLPTPGSVLGTDFVSYAAISNEAAARPPVLLLPDNQGDGPVLDNVGDKYEELDTTNGGNGSPFLFRATVLDTGGSDSTLHLEYNVVGVDPSIRPWPASANRQWQSPDIEVRNDRNRVDAQWFNVPWAQHVNEVVAHVANQGDLDATNVIVSFYAKNMSVADAPETFLGQTSNNVLARSTQDFSVLWIPPSEHGHYCIVVRIQPYVDFGSGIQELSFYNNIAQSNYTRFISSTNSPSTRERATITIQNTYAVPGWFLLVFGQTNELYRTYISRREVHLLPGEVSEVEILSEYAGGPGAEDSPYRHVPNNISVKGIWQPESGATPSDATVVTGGADVQVVEGKKVQCALAAVSQINGEVCVQGDVTRGGVDAPENYVIVTARNEKDASIWSATFRTIKGGECFAVPFDATSIEMYYVPPEGWADCSDQAEVP